ncbi:MAG: polyprenyl synthetase family protein [Gemmatimonadaceae bacterium]|nr:polyprenyl synthetase family protein [Gemmatimonadaceae bacterium]
MSAAGAASAAATASPDSSSGAASLARIRAPVQGLLEAVVEEMSRSVANDAPIVAQMGHHLMAMRGKMFRPTLLLLCSEVEGASEPAAIPLATAVEMIHLATLVHDDAIDHSVLRRGMPTLNSLFSHQLSVIMGDFLYSTALSRLVALGNLDALRVLTRASTEMSLGEMRQLAMTNALSFSEDDYDALIRSKTASLMSAACEVGSLCGARDYREELLSYGESLGTAFQIVDDLIDYTEARETTGKPTGLDLREHKVTLPLIAALRVMPAPDRRIVDDFFADPEPSDMSIAEVIRIVGENGGLDYARKRGAMFASRAEQALTGLPDTVARQSLIDSISYVMERHS